MTIHSRFTTTDRQTHRNSQLHQMRVETRQCNASTTTTHYGGTSLGYVWLLIQMKCEFLKYMWCERKVDELSMMSIIDHEGCVLQRPSKAINQATAASLGDNQTAVAVASRKVPFTDWIGSANSIATGSDSGVPIKMVCVVAPRNSGIPPKKIGSGWDWSWLWVMVFRQGIW